MSSQNGFTLLELLVVITIVSILTAISVPHYHEYRAKGFDLRALSDLRSVAIAEEAYFIDAEKYLACTTGACAQLPGISRISHGVSVQVTLPNTDSFVGTASHQKGSGRVYVWDSAQGGLQP